MSEQNNKSSKAFAMAVAVGVFITENFVHGTKRYFAPLNPKFWTDPSWRRDLDAQDPMLKYFKR